VASAVGPRPKSKATGSGGPTTLCGRSDRRASGRDGLVVRYNRRAAELWGRSPKLGDPDERFCGSYRMFRPDGSLLPHHRCTMADVLRTGISVRQQEVHIERPDGLRGALVVPAVGKQPARAGA
jgi:hypothetical protein